MTTRHRTISSKVALTATVTLAAIAITACQHAPKGEAPKQANYQLKSASQAPDPNRATSIQWQGWKDSQFADAKKGKRLVILDLEAVWCHWCHVMEDQTYSDPRVIKTIQDHYIAVRVDQDARPDLSRKYEDWGWPATIIFDGNGRELAKLSGFQEPDDLAALLEKLRLDPKPIENYEKKQLKLAAAPKDGGLFSTVLQQKLKQGHLRQYDAKNDGWGSSHKFLFGDTEEFALREAWRGDSRQAQMMTRTLDKAKSLLDPEWGGAYQYSVGGWDEPHFEKIAQKQYDNILLYSLGYALFKKPEYKDTAENVAMFLNGFLRDPAGAYYTSMDADLVKGEHSAEYFQLKDQARRANGVPAIDTHIYARENGLYIQAFAALYAVTGEEDHLENAIRAANWISKSRKLGNGFLHGAQNLSGPFLGDTLEMGLAFLKLYEVTQEVKWLEKAKLAALFIQQNFSHKIGGTPAGYGVEPVRDENIRVARFANLLHHYAAFAPAKAMAGQASKYLAIPEVAVEWPTGGMLLAIEETTQAPVHMTVVGRKNDPAAKALFSAALRYPNFYRRIDWWDKSQGPLPNPDVTYPELSRAAAFACSNGRCSLPAFDADELHARVDKLYH